MNNKLAMLAFSAVFMSPFMAEAKSRSPIKSNEQETEQTSLTASQKKDIERKTEEDFIKKADLVIDNLLPYLENQWVEGYYGFIYKDPVYMTAGIGTKFSIGKAKISDKEKEFAKQGDIVVNGEVMLDQIPFRHKSTGKELTYEEKVAYAKKAKATGCGGSFDGYKRHQKVAEREDVELTREDARRITRAELRYKIKRIRKLIQNRYKFDIFDKPLAVQMAFTDIAFMAGEGGLMKFKNALAQAKAGNYKKFSKFTDCGKGQARNKIRRSFAGLSVIEDSFDEKEMLRITKVLDKYDIDLPLVDRIKTDQTLLAQTNRAQEQMLQAQKTAAGVTGTLSTPIAIPSLAFVHTSLPLPHETATLEQSLLKPANDNDFYPIDRRLNVYDNIAQVLLDKYVPIRQSKTNLKRLHSFKDTSKTS